MTWVYRTVLSVCMTMIAWAIDRKLRPKKAAGKIRPVVKVGRES